MRALFTMLELEEARRWAARASGRKWLQRTRKSAAADDASPPSAARLFYFSVPPFLYERICATIAAVRSSAAGLDGSTALHEALDAGRGSDSLDVALGPVAPRSSMLAQHRMGLGAPPVPGERFILEKP